MNDRNKVGQLRRGIRLRKRWLVLVSPLLVLGGLMALAPDVPQQKQVAEDSVSMHETRRDGEPFQYIPDDEVYALDLDPRRVRFGLLEGWDREQDAFEDIAALAYVSGPMYERHVDNGGREITVPLGDLKFGSRVWKARNRTASRQRAFIGIRHSGVVDFSYGELTEDHTRTYDTFIGGLHSLYNDLEEPPASYKGAYSISMGQRIRYYLPRIRMVMGLRDDGYLEVLMSRDGLTLEQSKDLARRRGYLAAYMPDHASKSRFIIPGVKGFTEEDANWISGGATSFVHVPYMLRLSSRQIPLRGNLIANFAPRLPGDEACTGPLECLQAVGNRMADRALAGLNRVMEQGVEPFARLIWAPTNPVKPDVEQLPDPASGLNRSPLREPPITADPLVLLEPPSKLDPEVESMIKGRDYGGVEPFAPQVPLPPDLPPPVLLETASPDAPVIPDPDSDLGLNDDTDETMVIDLRDSLEGAPPPPELPPLNPPPLPVDSSN